MNLKGLSGGHYKPLSDDGIKTIHETAITILEKTGMTFESGLDDDTVDMLESAGARVDRIQGRIWFPGKLIEGQVKKAPSRIVLYSRNGKNDLDLTENRVYLGTGGAAVKVLDLETGNTRSTTLDDIYQIGRLVDRLNNIHFYVRPCIPTDISESDYDVNMFYACLKSTSKHVMSGVNNEVGFHRIVDLASMIAGDKSLLQKRPFISIITSFVISPFKLSPLSTRIMQEANRHGIPVAISSAPMSGSTSPMTMAGTLAQLHAEQLAGICICQLTKAGAPVLYGGIPGMANMRTMGYRGGGVECGMMNAAIHQLARHIGVPNYNSSGLTDSKLPDAQAGWEKAMTTLLAVMGGSNYVHHAAGMLESMLAVAYEQYVIDDEIIGMCCKVLKGIEVDPDHLALEVIDSIGPDGNFMVSEHTMEYMRKEYFDGNGVTDSRGRDKWEKDGGLDTRERARNLAKRILSETPTSHISADLDRSIRSKFKIFLVGAG